MIMDSPQQCCTAGKLSFQYDSMAMNGFRQIDAHDSVRESMVDVTPF